MEKIRFYFQIFAAFVIMFVVFPFLSILINTLLKWPVYSYVPFRIIGIFILVIGLFIVLNCAFVLFIKPNQYMSSPTSAPEKFIVEGLYKHTRNPMYLGDFLIIFSIFLLFGHLFLLVYFLVAIVFVNYVVINKEEKELEKRFGDIYLRYKHDMPRWIPQLHNR